MMISTRSMGFDIGVRLGLNQGPPGYAACPFELGAAPLSPEHYGERWGLPVDYPMVAPDYAKHRSSLAKRMGLGTNPRSAGRAKAG